MENKKTILVPWDFTEVAENALNHAVKVAKSTKDDITLINIIPSAKKEEEILKKLEHTAESAKKKYGVKPNVIVKTGSIYTTIRQYAEEIEADLVIMGTHGIKGVQKLTGSKALKVIEGSQVPFIVIQAPLHKEQYEKIVLPVDDSIENKEKLTWITFLSKYFNIKLTIFVPNLKDSSLMKKTKANLLFAKKYLHEKNIDFDITVSRYEKEDFAEQTIMFSKEVDADLVVIMTKKDIGFTDYVFGLNEQEIIANDAKIPVMCINPKKGLRKFESFY